MKNRTRKIRLISFSTTAVIVILLAVLLQSKPWNPVSNTRKVLEKAERALSTLQSYRYSVSAYQGDNSSSPVYRLEVDYSFPDNYQVKLTEPDYELEYILTGDEQYYLENYTSTRSIKDRISAHLPAVTGENSFRALGLLTGMERLEDETLEGNRCLHFRAIYSDGQDSRVNPPEKENRSPAEAGDEPAQVRDPGEAAVELWLGKNDYLVRRMKLTGTGKAGGNTTAALTLVYALSFFTDEFEVTAPTDSGELIAGWKKALPGNPLIIEEIRTEVDNRNPSSRKITYDISLRNSGKEKLEGVNINIFPGFPGPEAGTGNKIWLNWENTGGMEGPFSLEGSESLEYRAVFGYDATAVAPELIAGIIGKSYIEVIYSGREGQPQAEVLYFTVPDSVYTLSTELAGHLIPIEMAVAGEYRIDEPGAAFTGSGITGILNGRKYLFLEVNTASAEEPASPGILILDIQDITAPEKVSFLSTGDDTRYLRGAALYGNHLYVSADETLWIIDVSNPAFPAEVARVKDFDTNQMLTYGKFAFISENNLGIFVLDLSDPANPQRPGFISLPSATGIQMEISGKFMYVKAGDVLYTINLALPKTAWIISDRSFNAPLEEGASGELFQYQIEGIDAGGNYLYLTTGIEDTLAIAILDITKPYTPVDTAFYRLKERRLFWPAFVSGDKLYIATRLVHDIERKVRLEILDISAPENPMMNGFGNMPDPRSFFREPSGNIDQAYRVIDGYLYWFIGNSPNKPVIQILELP